MIGRPKIQRQMPTQEQETWLKANYKLYNRYHLVKHLGIADKLLTVWFHHLGLNKRNGKQVTLTKEQKKFVKDNYLTTSKEAMAVKLGVAVTTIQRYCNRNKLTDLKHIEPKAPPKQIISFAQPSKPPSPPAAYGNISREQHVDKWLQVPVEIEEKPYQPVKCLEEWQMKYIMANYEQMTSKQLAEELKLELFQVNLFCQKNAITSKQGKKKPKDVFHNILPERQMRMKRVDYNGPQKKTA